MILESLTEELLKSHISKLYFIKISLHKIFYSQISGIIIYWRRTIYYSWNSRHRVKFSQKFFSTKPKFKKIIFSYSVPHYLYKYILRKKQLATQNLYLVPSYSLWFDQSVLGAEILQFCLTTECYNVLGSVI